MSLTALLIPAYTQMLKALSAWLDKAQEQIDDAETLLSARFLAVHDGDFRIRLHRG